MRCLRCAGNIARLRSFDRHAFCMRHLMPVRALADGAGGSLVTIISSISVSTAVKSALLR
jgi:hypothetical protein